MSEMVERVAKALAACDNSDWRAWVDDARAAIEAMREPTKAQLSGASMAIGPWGGHGEAGPPSYERVWREMIDAALAQK